MKAYKIISKISIVLLIVLLGLASFVGVFKLNGYEIKNIIKDYSLGMEFEGSEVFYLDVDTSEKTSIYDKDGNLVEDEDENVEYTEENGYTTKTEKVNPMLGDEKQEKSSFSKSKDIVAKRLKSLGIEQYNLKQDEDGNITIEIPKTKEADRLMTYVIQRGVFSVKDSETDEELLNSSDIKSTEFNFYTQQDQSVTTVLLINLNKKGKEKFKEMSDIYVETAENVTNEETGETEEQTTQKKVTVAIDETSLLETYFQKDIELGMVVWLDADKGIITIPVGSSTTNEQLTEYTDNVKGLKTILDTGELPVVYNVTADTVSASYEKSDLTLLMYVIIIIFAMATIVLTWKYKLNGLLIAISEVGYIACLLILVRLTNVILTISGMMGIILSAILNIVFMLSLLKNKKESSLKQIFMKFTLNIIPVIIISVIFAFATLADLASFGMTLFWGMLLVYVYNLIFTNNLI